ncbi:Hypothetical protein GbCGDNIH5_8167a [Granulibacter bethesdensis]|nr:Hypothetical protein GbCGDNIH5_8167a [Granulibacter bethesdensis]
MGVPECPRGSISAHAEEPCFTRPIKIKQKVYLRARGGTAPEPARGDDDTGLSPRTRRNQMAFFRHPSA